MGLGASVVCLKLEVAWCGACLVWSPNLQLEKAVLAACVAQSGQQK